jgi:hypothetical protein
VRLVPIDEIDLLDAGFGEGRHGFTIPVDALCAQPDR